MGGLREVSTNGTRVLLCALDAEKVPLAPLLAGLPVNEERLRASGGRIDWEVWVTLVERTAAALGGAVELERFAERLVRDPPAHPFSRVASLFASPLALYRLNSRWGIPNQYRNMTSSLSDLGDDCVHVVCTIPASDRGSTAVFHSAIGILTGLPQVIGLPASTRLSARVWSHGAELTLRLPPSRTLGTFARRLRRGLSGLGTIVEQLTLQEQELREKHHVLERQLEEQKRVEAALRASEERWRELALLAEQREAALARAQQMEALGQLAGKVAHDFNNLLTVVLGAAHLLESTPLGDEQRDEVREIRRAADRGVQLTRQLLTFSRQRTQAPRVVSLSEVLENARGMLERLLGERVRLEISSEASWPVRIDPGKFEQVLMNLAVNARDAMAQGGTLTITTRDVPAEPGASRGARNAPAGAAGDGAAGDGAADAADAAGDGAPAGNGAPADWVELAVRDTGVGMSPQTLERIFDPFYTTKPEGLGTGLGLAIVRAMVIQSNGQVWVDSELGRGSTFTVRWPRADALVDAAPASSPPPASRGSENILLVEDDAQVRGLARKVLVERGYRVIDCAGASEALERAHGKHIDLLLAEVAMPEMDGPELARQLSRDHDNLPVLFMSGGGENETGYRGALDPDALLPKPFGPDALALGVRRALDRSAGAEP